MGSQAEDPARQRVALIKRVQELEDVMRRLIPAAEFGAKVASLHGVTREQRKAAEEALADARLLVGQ